MSYQYDVFISYPRKSPARDWVYQFFHKELENWLAESVPYSIAIFVDRQDVGPGVNWPETIQQALLRSKCLVPVFCPGYFRSDWCRAELASFQQREASLGLRNPTAPAGLIFPVTYHDGDHFPPEIKDIQQTDMRPWNHPAPVFKQVPAYLEFVQAVQTFAERLGAALAQIPPWQNGWPIVVPEPTRPTTLSLPRL